MIPTYRVSHLAAFARWREDEDSDFGWLINQILHSEQTELMAKGTAFHKALELSTEGDYDQISVDGYTFHFTGSFELYIPPMREWRRERNYGGIIVSGQCDAILGNTIYDHKSTERFDAEKYLSGWQYRFYLDIFNAQRFIWNVWEMNEMKDPKHYNVHSLHRLEQFRYAGMEEECRELAQDFKEFAHKWIEPIRSQSQAWMPPSVPQPETTIDYEALPF